MKPVPVTTLNRPATYRAAAASILKLDRNGLCIRVNISELTDEKFARHLAAAIDELGASLAESDLVLDYGVFDAKAPGIADLLSKVPELQNWRSVIVARGAFPKDLHGLKPGTHKIARSDWTDWVIGLRGSAHSRWPSYSDYTIQYGQYIEPCKGANPSASIRYTAGIEMSQPQTTSASGLLSPSAEATQALGQQFGQLGMEVTRKNLNIQPTVKIRPGYRFNVRVNRDIAFAEPYADTEAGQ